jgi:hypothetical protein
MQDDFQISGLSADDGGGAGDVGVVDTAAHDTTNDVTTADATSDVAAQDGTSDAPANEATSDALVPRDAWSGPGDAVALDAWTLPEAAPTPVCGDGTCQASESCATCQIDCACPYELHVQAADIQGGWYATQCLAQDASQQLVWKSSADTGCPTCTAAYAYAYQQSSAPPGYPCETASNGIYPIVFTAGSAPAVGSWVVQCTNTSGFAYVFKVTESVGGRPVAPFQYKQPGTSSCP